MRFRDRQNAGEQLAVELKRLSLQDPLILGIPRGGVVIGAVLAEALGGELDVVLSRKLRAPWQPELAIGAVAEDGQVYLNESAAAVPGLTQEYLARERDHQLEEIARRRAMYRAVRPQAPVAGRSVIVTDDGIATGSTMIAALDVLRTQAPRELIAAVPVAPPDRLDDLRSRCDQLICLYSPHDFWAVGQYYDRFEEVSDETVIELLRRSAAKAPHAG